MNITKLSLHQGVSTVSFKGLKEPQKTDKENNSSPAVNLKTKIPKSSLVMLAALFVGYFAPIYSALRASDPVKDFSIVSTENVDIKAQTNTKKELIAKENQAARILIQQLFQNAYEPFIDAVYQSKGLFSIPLYEEDCKSDIKQFYTVKENSQRFLDNILRLGDQTPKWNDEENFGYYAKEIIQLVKYIEKEPFKNEDVWQPLKQKLDADTRKAKPYLDAYKVILEFAIKNNKGQSGVWEETLYPAMEAVGFKVNTSDF